MCRPLPGQGLDINGKSSADAKAAVTEWLAAVGRGGRQVNYKLRDWLFARQRYWGEPFPLVRVCVFLRMRVPL